MFRKTVTAALAALAALVASTVLAPSAQAHWTPTAPAKVLTRPCTATGESGDAVASRDGLTRGFVRLEGGNCAEARSIYVEGRGSSWRVAQSPYAGRVLAAADDGSATWLLFAASDGVRLGRRLRTGSFAASQLLSGGRSAHGDLIAESGRWWAVWSERISPTMSSVFQARTMVTTVPRRRITYLDRLDEQVSIVRRPAGGAVIAWQRTDAATGRADVLIGRTGGGDWQFQQLTSNGVSRAPALAVLGNREYVVWTQSTRLAYADTTSGYWRSRLLDASGRAPRIAASAGHVHIAWTTHATPSRVGLAERSGDVWVYRDLPPSAAVRQSAVGVASAAGTATVVVAAPSEVWAQTQTRPSVDSFRRLGTWVDLFDRSVSPPAAVARMKAHGVRTIYLQTARYSSPADIADAGWTTQWLEAAHAAGLRVVGWYLPGYSEHLETDVRRTLAIASFVTGSGHRFDALAVDIEYQDASESVAAFNADVAMHLARVRAGVGARYPVGAIVPAPLGMALNPAKWSGFPWAAIGRDADVVLPMGYWSYRTDCPSNPKHCAYEYTRGNITAAARYTGLPVHAIGGIGNAVTAAQVGDFVRAARQLFALGGSSYDYATTSAEQWAQLEGLR